MVLALASVQPLRRTSSSFSAQNPPCVGLQRTYSKNIMNLEQMAEDISQGGSDIGEEIRRMNEEQKAREGSRRSSLQSSHQGDAGGLTGGGAVERVRSRGESNANGRNIVDVNGAARWGGYSPGGFVGSPLGSQRSSSGRSYASRYRKASEASSSRLAQMVEPAQEGRPLDSPLRPSMSVHSLSTVDNEDGRQHSGNSFERQYDQIATQIEQSLHHVPQSPSRQTGHEDDRDAPNTPMRKPRSQDTFQEAQLAFKDFDGVHYSPEKDEFIELDNLGNEVRRVSARSTSGGMSMQTASMLRTPQRMSYAEPPPSDGMVYYPAPVPRMLNLPKRLSQLPSASVQAQRRSQVLGQLAPEQRASAPWIPAFDFADQESKTRGQESSHRGQASDPMRPGSGHSRAGSGQHSSGSQYNSPQQPVNHPRSALNQRMSTANIQNLPPQLRASIFFEHQSVGQDVQVKNESAVATLDAILASSATAPVSAFTDHPFAGDLRKSTYAPERVRNRRSTATLASMLPSDPETIRKVKVQRRSSLGNLLRRNSSAMDLDKHTEKRGSRAGSLMMGDLNEGGKRLQKRRSQMSLGDDVTGQLDPEHTSQSRNAADDHAVADGEEDEEGYADATSRPVTAHSYRLLNEGTEIDDDFKDKEAAEDVAEELGGEVMFVQPSTLLAELQVRKAQQKSRNRTAVTHYPNGMHSTLLQMDAVEEISRNKRKKQRVGLAWEGPPTSQAELLGGEMEGDDEDVPLGFLFPGKDGVVAGKRKVGDGKDWDRPLGLMEKRAMEDSEPLSSRRNRMLGLPPNFGRAEREASKAGLVSPGVNRGYFVEQPVDGDDKEAEDGVETLAERLRRLKTKDALDTAISDTVPKAGSRPISTFSDDVLGRFAPLENRNAEVSKPATPLGSPPASRGNSIAGALDKADNQASNTFDQTTAEPPEEEAEEEEEEEETLTQRRARLQRARDVSSRAGITQLLASNPVLSTGNATRGKAAAKDHQPPEGTLLHKSAIEQAKQRSALLNTNLRSSSYYGAKVPLAPPVFGAQQRSVSSTGLLAQQQGGYAQATAGGFASGVYNNGLGGISMQGVGGGGVGTPGSYAQSGYFSPPVMGGGQGSGYNPMIMPMTSQQQFLQQQQGYGSVAAYGYGFPPPQQQLGYPMQTPVAGMVPEPQMERGKRDGIDAWRQSVLH
ncbi:hypothetical protein LTR62_003180 [Meristemomyces frigidus]|uniref:Uncharacterized protein n=1 Tax=Meristemomyces frigidus TaxID=1508187 RepID=A0AAN7TFR7_9PEZI|nr:hypothetical protein LTR62_003180 [Meristemomyces frigidus]